MEWQDISTAPKDRPIIVPEIRAGFCLPRVVVWRECPYLGALVGEAWRPLDDPQRALKPAHWMPLPVPPEAM